MNANYVLVLLLILSLLALLLHNKNNLANEEEIRNKLGIYKYVTGAIQIGAHTGEEAERDAKYVKDKVIWIEAQPQKAVECQNHVKKYGQKCIQALVWNKTGEQKQFHVTDNSVSSSILLPIVGHSPVNHKIDLTTITYKDLTKIYPELLNPVYNHLVLDTQGAEYEIIEGMGDLIQQFDILEVEISNYEGYKGQKQQPAITELLDSKGYKCVDDCKHTTGHGIAYYRKKSLK